MCCRSSNNLKIKQKIFNKNKRQEEKASEEQKKN